MKILVVDDNRESLFILETLLRASGYYTESALNGVDALKKLSENSFDVVISDILMPDMDGFQLCRKIKTNERLKKTAFVFYTATYLDPKDEEFALSLGAERFIAKPEDPKVFVEILKEVIHKREKGVLSASRVPFEDDQVYLKLYNERLVQKLEDKMVQLEKTKILLEENRNLLKRIFESEPECVKLVTSEGNIMDINPAGLDMYEIDTLEEAIGKSIYSFVVPKDREAVKKFTENVFRGEPGVLEFEIMGQKGTPRILESHAVPLRNQKNEIIARLTVTRDITERKRLVENLAIERERLFVTLNAITEGIFSVNIEKKVILMNSAAENITGYRREEIYDRPISEISFEISLTSSEQTLKSLEDLVAKVLDTGTPIDVFETEILVPESRKRIIISIGAFPIRDEKDKIAGAVVVFRDISEEKKITEELQKAQRLESLGVFAGGVAHDFNNILTGILGNVFLAKISLDSASDAYRKLAEAEKASRRASELAQQLLKFSKSSAPVKRLASFKEVLGHSVEFFLRGSNIGTSISIPDGLWPGEFDEVQISQVIQNLIINARQAMPKGGTIQVGARNVTVGETNTEMVPLGRGNYVEILIQDQGPGISKEILSKIFDPFFTTKIKGSGLGLFVTRSIIQKHGGLIKVESESGKGTTFLIYLPAVPSALLPERKNDEILMKGRGRVLIMDDDDGILNIAGEMLGHLGYEAVKVHSESSALEEFIKAAEAMQPFDIVIADLTIRGGPGGIELLNNLREIDSKVKVIVSTGSYNDPVVVAYKSIGFSDIILKPYQILEISKILYRNLMGEN